MKERYVERKLPDTNFWGVWDWDKAEWLVGPYLTEEEAKSKTIFENYNHMFGKIVE